MNTPPPGVEGAAPERSSATVRRALLAPLAAVLVGIASGLVWLWLAKPAEWEVREGGIVLTEAASKGQFSVIVVFVAVGAVASLAGGWALARVLPDLGWFLIPACLVLTSVAALVAWRVGVELGPPPPTKVEGVQVGDRLPAQLAVDAVAPFLVWPIFGLLGLMAATWADGRRDQGTAAITNP